MNARTMSPDAKLVAWLTSDEHAQARATRLNFDPLDLLRGIGRSARGGITAGQINFQLTCQ
jgi:hypothetical protein